MRMKMPIEVGNHLFDAEEFVSEALSALPFLAPDYHGHFREVFLKHREDGSGLVRRVLKLAPPEELFQNLGERDAEDAVYAIIGRISANIYRHWRKLSEESHRASGGFRYKEARCVIDVTEACNQACEMDGLVVPVDDRCMFPLPGCNKDCCRCEWELIYPFKKN